MASTNLDGQGREIHLVDVFVSPSPASTAQNPSFQGGNLAPIVLDAAGMTASEMRAVATRYGRESAFVFPAPNNSGVDHQLRFFVPEHEMEMCGHATVGVAWVMHNLARARQSKGEMREEMRFLTKSGIVRTRCDYEREGDLDDDEGGGNGAGFKVFVSQPRGTVEDITDPGFISEILSVLRIDSSQLAHAIPFQNSRTSRVKTMIPLDSPHTLNTLSPDFSHVKLLCERLDSTGLYPYAVFSHHAETPTREGQHEAGDVIEVEARQFPKASGYPEDAATGIAAAALAWALERNAVAKLGGKVIVHQGRAMGGLSRIEVHLEEGGEGCWIGGRCQWGDCPV